MQVQLALPFTFRLLLLSYPFLYFKSISFLGKQLLQSAKQGAFKIFYCGKFRGNLLHRGPSPFLVWFFVHLILYQGEGPFFYIRELFFIHFLIPSAHEHFTLTRAQLDGHGHREASSSPDPVVTTRPLYTIVAS
ncbi:hypothetical protein CULT_100061 [[Clostridium] ultunense Esp]|nr:hypothetical protein CULT_100061 [[Clostridium] ultunense Esp]